MKQRIYSSLSEKMFCPHCHRQIQHPFAGQQMKIAGSINLLCGSCNKGKATVVARKEELTI